MNIVSGEKFALLDETGVTMKNPITKEMCELPNYLRANYMMIFKRLM